LPLNFDNTEIAFSYLSNRELIKEYYIFKILNQPGLSKLGKSFTMKAFDLGLPITGLVKDTIFDAFVGGETIEESEPEIGMLQDNNVGTILDYGVEAKNDEKQLNGIAGHIESIVRQVYRDQQYHVNACAKISAFANNELLEKVSNKTTLTAEENELWERVLARTNTVCAAAHECNVALYLDAEESWIQPAIDLIVETMMERYNTEKPIIFQTVQLYRHDRLDYLKTLHTTAKDKGYILAVKLVRGAYMEKERERAKELGYKSPIQPDKAATDSDYNRAVEYCLEHIDEICMCLATHNEESNYFLEELLQHQGISKHHPHIITAQLFGMGDHITFNMAADGYHAVKYLPYGPVKELLPYLLRRANENSSVDGQASRELSLLKKEIKRRKLKVFL